MSGEFEASRVFAPCIRFIPGGGTTRASYRSFLLTRSELRMLAPEKREGLIAALSRAVEDQGGAFTLDYETHLYMARRDQGDRRRGDEG